MVSQHGGHGSASVIEPVCSLGAPKQRNESPEVSRSSQRRDSISQALFRLKSNFREVPLPGSAPGGTSSSKHRHFGWTPSCSAAQPTSSLE